MTEAVAGDGLTIVEAVTLPPGGDAFMRGYLGQPGYTGEGQLSDAWLAVRSDGSVTAFGGKTEFGQGIRAGLAAGVANELRLPLERVQLVLGDTDRTPWDVGTHTSRSTAQLGLQLRRAAATARDVLLELATDRLDLPTTELECRDGGVVSRSDPRRRVGFDELLQGQALRHEVRHEAELTPASEFTVSDEVMARAHGARRVTGQVEYPSDVRMPGTRTSRGV